MALFSVNWWRRPRVADPTSSLRDEALAEPESDELESRVIQRERDDIERGEQGFLND